MSIKEIISGSDYYIEKTFEGLRAAATYPDVVFALQQLDNLLGVIIKLDEYFNENNIVIEFDKTALVSSCMFLKVYLMEERENEEHDLTFMHIKPYAAYLSLYFSCLKKLS